MIVPGSFISIGCSLAIYILLDKGVAPGEAMIQSNKATYGYKWTIFGVSLLLGVAFYILLWIIFAIADGGFAMFLLFLVSIVYTVAALGCSAVIYRDLTAEPKPETMETVVEVLNTIEKHQSPFSLPHTTRKLAVERDFFISPTHPRNINADSELLLKFQVNAKN